MKINVTLLIAGTILMGLLIISWFADRGGRMGIYSADNTFPASNDGWTPPAKSFRSAGCCTDDVRSAAWDGRTLDLYTGDQTIALSLSTGTGTTKHLIPGASDVLGAVAACRHVWLPETRHERLLEVTAGGNYNTEVGSNLVGSVNGIAVLPHSPLTLILTTGPRDSTDEFLVQPAAAIPGSNAEKLYLSRSGLSRPLLVQLQPESGAAPMPLAIGEDLWSPSGIAAGSDGKTLYVSDERRDEVAWLKIKSTGNPAAPWVSEGKIARFPLSEDDARGIQRGLVVVQQQGQDILAGAVPGGLAFVTTDGKRLGRIATADPISRLLLGMKSYAVRPGSKRYEDEPVLYVIAGRTIWEARLRNVTLPPGPACSAAPAEPKAPLHAG